jgi:nitronate monooxygenase
VSLATTFTERVGVELPIVQAPMATSTSPELVAAVSEAGALGSLPVALLEPDAVREQIRAVRALTDRPFNVNLFALGDVPAPAAGAEAATDAVMGPHRERLGVPEPGAPAALALSELVAAELEVIAAERVPVVSFTFGIPPLDAVREAGAVIVGTATSVAEAVALADAGVDVVVAQGSEAGGHRGTFLGPPERSLVGTIALVPQVVDAVGVPVLAAGGIMDGRGIAAALALGAAGAQLGTAFLRCAEAATPVPYREALAAAADTATTVTDIFTGRHARMIETRVIEELLDGVPAPLPFPLQAARTRPVHAAAAERGERELMFLLSGQGAPLGRDLPAAELVAALARETEAARAT